MNAMRHEPDLLIVGGDPVGLLLALLGAQRFMQVTVIGDDTESTHDGMVHLDAEALQVFERAGLRDALRLITESATAGVRRAQLVALLGRAAVEAGVTLQPRCRMTSFDVAPNGEFVVAHLDDGSDEGAQTLGTRWLVGADAAVRVGLDVDVVEHESTLLAAQFRDGPVFLVGAGACVGPRLGERALSLGCSDVSSLAWRLQAVHQGHAHSRLLDAYDTERRPQIAAHLSGEGPEFTALLVGQLAGDHALVGRLLAPTSIGGCPLDDRLNHGWAILTSDVALLPHDLLARWIGIGARIVMLDDQLGDVAGAPEHGAVIVRPDRVVAAVAHDAEAFEVVSEQLFGWYADGEPTGEPFR